MIKHRRVGAGCFALHREETKKVAPRKLNDWTPSWTSHTQLPGGKRVGAPTHSEVPPVIVIHRLAVNTSD